MEQLFDYRHIVEKKMKKIFIDSLRKALKELKIKNIGFVGIIGSVKEEYSHDVDVLIFQSGDAKLGETIIEISKLYGHVEKILRKHDERLYLSLSPKKAMQEMVYYLSSLEEGGAGLIPVHSLFFSDYASFKKMNPKDFQRMIKKDMISLYGKFGVIKSTKKLPQKKLEPYFIILDFEMNARTKTFPKHLVRTSAESLFSYLKEKYDIPIKKKKLHNLKDIEKELERILKYLDKITYG